MDYFLFLKHSQMQNTNVVAKWSLFTFIFKLSVLLLGKTPNQESECKLKQYAWMFAYDFYFHSKYASFEFFFKSNGNCNEWFCVKTDLWHTHTTIKQISQKIKKKKKNKDIINLTVVFYCVSETKRTKKFKNLSIATKTV